MNESITILFVGLGPVDRESLELTREAEAIQRALLATEYGRRFGLIQRWLTEAHELPGLLMEHRPRIVHFGGHGTGEGGLDFHGAGGRASPAACKDIAEAFRLIEGVCCVVVNACYTAELARQIADHVDATVGMNNEISDGDAIAFAAGFYQALGHGKDLATAFDLGRLRVSPPQRGVSPCKLHLREGFDASRLRLHETRGGVDGDWLDRLRRGIAAVNAPPGFGLLGVSPRSGVTIEALFVGPLLDLMPGGAYTVLDSLAGFCDENGNGNFLCFEDFEAAWRGTLATWPDAPASPLRVVVRGGPGSGKSTLCRYLSVRAASADGPLPLLFQVRRWMNEGRLGILEHLAQQATEILRIPTTASQLETLCARGQAQLFIDGFDELPAAEHASLRERLHGVAEAYPAMPILVTSRPALAAGSRLGLDGFVELRLEPFTEEQVLLFAARWGEGLINSTGAGLRAALEADPHAMHLARIPLFAALLAVIHARGQRLPARRATLYAQCIEGILVAWPRQQPSRRLPESTEDHLGPVLEELALAIQSRRDDNFAASLGFSKVSLDDERIDLRLAEGLARARPELGEGDRRVLLRE
ncbi:MAG: NACHT domain-containing protein [Myxococcales bacterium]|nr:NACHT domain-containing protein [Myxococcales bacterium]